MRPVIGISTYREQARWGAWDVPAVLLPATYADAVAAAGGEPVLLPTGATTGAAVRALDGLVIAGGADVEPGRYGAEQDPMTVGMRPDRDEAEVGLLEAALAADLPVLAICRGMQLLNVVLGGTLHQHVPDLPCAGDHDPGPGGYTRREVRVQDGSRLAAILGSVASGDCHHHQCLDVIGPGLVPVAWAEDGLVEAVEGDGTAFRVGVQWHPEVGPDRRLFTALVSAGAGGP